MLYDFIYTHTQTHCSFGFDMRTSIQIYYIHPIIIAHIFNIQNVPYLLRKLNENKA